MAIATVMVVVVAPTLVAELTLNGAGNDNDVTRCLLYVRALFASVPHCALPLATPSTRRERVGKRTGNGEGDSARLVTTAMDMHLLQKRKKQQPRVVTPSTGSHCLNVLEQINKHDLHAQKHDMLTTRPVNSHAHDYYSE